MSDVYSESPWLKHYDGQVSPAIKYEETSFADKFAETVRKYPDKTALIYLGSKLSFREVDILSNRLASFLIKSGLKPDDVVGLHLPNIPAHYIGVLGAQKAGCVTTGLSPLLTAHEMEHQLKDSGTKIVLTVDVLFSKIAEVADKAPFTTVVVSEIADFLPGVKRVLGKLLKKIPTGAVTPLPGKTIKRFTEVMKEMPGDPVLVKRGFDDMIFMMYTGGTTGPAKGAVLTQRSYMSNFQQTIPWLDMQTDDIGLSAFPMFHIAGLALGGFSLTLGYDTDMRTESAGFAFPDRGAGQVSSYLRGERAHGVFRAVEKTGIPRPGPEGPSEMVPQRRGALSGGEHQGARVDHRRGQFHRALRHDGDVPGDAAAIPGSERRKPGSIGMPLSDTAVKLVDPETGELAKAGGSGRNRHPGTADHAGVL